MVAEPCDAEIARRYLAGNDATSSESRLQAARVLARVGEFGDADRIADALVAWPAEARAEMSRCALDLAPGLAGIAPRLLSLGDEAIRRVVIASLPAGNWPTTRGS